jgi:hypothetical protein
LVFDRRWELHGEQCIGFTSRGTHDELTVRTLAASSTLGADAKVEKAAVAVTRLDGEIVCNNSPLIRGRLSFLEFEFATMAPQTP